MRDLIMLARLIWSVVCWIGRALAVPFCVLLAVATAAGVFALAVCIEIEVRKDREKAAKAQ